MLASPPPYGTHTYERTRWAAGTGRVSSYSSGRCRSWSAGASISAASPCTVGCANTSITPTSTCPYASRSSASIRIASSE